MSSYDELEKRIRDIQTVIAEATTASARDSHAVTLIAVSKTFSRDDVEAAYTCGLRHFGENRIQEAQAKFEQPLPDDAVLHLIGHLQSNKAKLVPALFSTVDSVDRPSIVKALEKSAVQHEVTLDVLIQVNIAGESKKSGCHPDQAIDILRAITTTDRLKARGLMTIAPIDATGDRLCGVFRGLRQLRDYLQEVASCDLPELSMGMSDDFHDAIAEGATQIRLGRAIFGER